MHHSSPELFLFLASTAHDMKNSISVLSGTLERLLDGATPETEKAYGQMGQMLYQTRRLNDNLMQLLALYKQVGKPGYPFDVQPLEVGQVVEQVVALSRVLLESRGIRLELDVDPELLGHVDEDLIVGVVSHAVNNALHYTRDRILLAVARGRRAVRDPRRRQRRRFSAGPAGSRHAAESGDIGVNFATNSAGLGLYFSSEVARMHQHRGRHGAVRLENGGAAGRRLLHPDTAMTTPAAAIAALVPTPTPAGPTPALPKVLEQIDWASKHYLIVDDFVGIRQLLRESLRSLGARTIDQASSGGEAMSLLTKTRYDVVLCDYNLGEGKNGQQVLEEARMRSLLLPSSVFVMVSAEKSVESVMGAAEHQPDAYLVKPITEGVLLSRLNRVWRRKQVFRLIDQAFMPKRITCAPRRLCDEQIAANRMHVIELLRMKARDAQGSGQPAQGARRLRAGAGSSANTTGPALAWARFAWPTATSSRRARCSRP